jgi:hypothetical protein
MKIKNLSTMIAVVLIATLAGFAGCAFDGSGNDLHPEKTYKTIEIDSCEYIFISRRPFASDMALTHKGNCKYCEQRKAKSR